MLVLEVLNKIFARNSTPILNSLLGWSLIGALCVSPDRHQSIYLLTIMMASAYNSLASLPYACTK